MTMRLDQLQRLQELSEGMADVVISEMDTAAWPGAGKPLAEITKDERGDRYWCKKNAAASLSLLVKLLSVTGMVARAGSGMITPSELPTSGDGVQDDLDAQIAEAERKAEAMLKRAQGQHGRVH